MAKIEDYTQDYALTVTLNPRIREKGTAEQHIYMRSYIECILKDRIMQYVADYKGIKMKDLKRPRLTLVTELTKSYDIHYHGILSFPMSYGLRCPEIFMRNLFRDRYKGNPAKMEQKDYIGFILLKPVEDWGKWSDYIAKDIDDFKQKMKMGPIICDDYEFFEAEDWLAYNAYALDKPTPDT